MSLFRPVNLVCPNCKELIVMEAVGSINADRRPDYRDAILADDFQDVTCGSCDHSFRLQPQFNYLDVGRGQWIASLPAARLPEYLAAEDEATDLFDKSYGAQASDAARAIGDELDMRVTFGWPGVREKILIREHELDDVILEMAKLDILRSVTSAPLAPGTELRLVAVLEDDLAFVWLDTASEDAVSNLVVSRDVYDDIAANADDWAATRERLEDGPFVDMQKLYMGEGRMAS